MVEAESQTQQLFVQQHQRQKGSVWSMPQLNRTVLLMATVQRRVAMPIK